MRSLRTWWMKRPPLILRRFLDGVSRWCEFDLEARMPVRDIRWGAPPVALCRAHRWNRAQPDQSGRCAARNGIHQLLKLILTYCIPYVVCTYGAASYRLKKADVTLERSV